MRRLRIFMMQKTHTQNRMTATTMTTTIAMMTPFARDLLREDVVLLAATSAASEARTSRGNKSRDRIFLEVMVIPMK